MSLVFRIAWRYFFSKSTQTVVNRINNIALLVIIVASASLMIVLSAFSGLREFGLSFSSVFDPDYKVLPLQGKIILVDDKDKLIKKFWGIGLDVVDPEPLPKNHFLRKKENVIITNHTAGLSDKNRSRAYDLIFNNLKRYKENKMLFNEVNKIEGY